MHDTRTHWLWAQQKYVGWANHRLPTKYMRDIVRLGIMFKKFIGSSGKCLDIGCGNGLIDGKAYKDTGYQYLDKGAIGIDPLTLQGPKPPWIKEYIQAIAENMPFKNDYFDTITFATTLDHIENLTACMQECYRVLNKTGTMNIWLTCRLMDDWPDKGSHANCFTQPKLEKLVTSHGFVIVDRQLEPWRGVGANGVVVTSGNTVFIKAKKEI